jgi:hypothetical protein
MNTPIQMNRDFTIEDERELRKIREESDLKKAREAMVREKCEAIARRPFLKARLEALKSWEYPQIRCDSPVLVDHSYREHWKWLLRLFPDDGLVKLSALSGPDWVSQYKQKADWLQSLSRPAMSICSSIFTPEQNGEYQVLSQPFFVVQSDFLDANQMGSIFRFLKEDLQFLLKCVVSKGGETLEGWFDCSQGELMKPVQQTLVRLGVSKNGLRSTYSHCLPGTYSHGKRFSIAYLSQEVMG